MKVAAAQASIMSPVNNIQEEVANKINTKTVITILETQTKM